MVVNAAVLVAPVLMVALLGCSVIDMDKQILDDLGILMVAMNKNREETFI